MYLLKVKTQMTLDRLLDEAPRMPLSQCHWSVVDYFPPTWKDRLVLVCAVTEGVSLEYLRDAVTVSLGRQYADLVAINHEGGLLLEESSALRQDYYQGWKA